MQVEEDTSVQILRDKLSASLERNCCLEKENEQLKQEVLCLRKQITLLRVQDCQKRSTPWKKVQDPIASNNFSQEKQMAYATNGGRHEFSVSLATTKERTPRVPKPPPTPTAFHLTRKAGGQEAKLPPPPPPPLPLKRHGVSRNSVRRVPEVIELYRALTRKDGKQEMRTGATGIPAVPNAREMIGEIENRSSYLLAVSTYFSWILSVCIASKNTTQFHIDRGSNHTDQVRRWKPRWVHQLIEEWGGECSLQRDLWRGSIRQVAGSGALQLGRWESSAQALPTVAGEESRCDERSILLLSRSKESRIGRRIISRRFQSADVCFTQMHTGTARQVRNRTRRRVESPPINKLSKKALSLSPFCRLERSVHDFEKVRESAMRRYRDFKIPWEWMLDSGIINQVRLALDLYSFDNTWSEEM